MMNHQTSSKHHSQLPLPLAIIPMAMPGKLPAPPQPNLLYACMSCAHLLPSTIHAHMCRELARASNIPTQDFSVRSDMACGSTIGPILASGLGCRTVDVGSAQLAMHSIREMAAVADVAHAYAHFRAFFQVRVRDWCESLCGWDAEGRCGQVSEGIAGTECKSWQGWSSYIMVIRRSASVLFCITPVVQLNHSSILLTQWAAIGIAYCCTE